MVAAGLSLGKGKTLPPEIGSLKLYQKDYKAERYTTDPDNYMQFHEVKTRSCTRQDFYFDEEGDAESPSDALFYPTEKS